MLRPVLISALGLALLGCGGESSSQTSTTGDPSDCRGVTAGSKGPGAFAADYKTSSAFFTRMSGLNEDGSSIHGATQIWYSCNLYGLLADSPLEVPEGTVAIKVQDRDKDGKIESMRVMIKHAKGFASTFGDFSFEARDPEGKDPKDQSGNFCFGCHQGYASTGYLAGTALTN